MSGLWLAIWLGVAHAGSDVWTSTAGAQWVRSQAVGEADLDLLLGQRLRWTVQDGPSLETRALVDARLTVDPDTEGGQNVERARVSSVAAELSGQGWRVTLGRSPVYLGGPRLVDGAQALGRFESGVEVGAWAGLAPDLFTTAPRVRPGGGPILAWTESRAQLSTVGEVLVGPDGLDRAGVVTQARYGPGPGLQTSARADVQLSDAEGRGGLADAAIGVRWVPVPAWRTDVLYNAFSSLRYLQSSDLDPAIRRFSARIEALGLAEGIVQDTPDPTLNHLLALRNGVRRPDGEVRPRADLDTRYRHHADPANRYGRIHPGLGVDGLARDRLSVDLDGSILWIDGGVQQDAGLALWVDLVGSGDLAVDSSIRVLLDPDDYGDRPGWYTDGFVEGLVADRLVFVAGVSLEHEPLIAFDDVAIGAFCQLATTVRRARSAGRSEPGSRSRPRAGTPTAARLPRR